MDLNTTETGELLLDENQELSFLYGHADVIAAVRALLRTFVGEWWLDPSFGINWLEKVLVKDFSAGTAGAEIRRKVMTIDGVLRIDALRVQLSPDQSEVRITLVLTSIYSDQPETLQEVIAP